MEKTMNNGCRQPAVGYFHQKKAGFLILLIFFGLLAGCATHGRVQVEEAKEFPGGAVPSVTRFDDGREGFVIQEVPSIDDESRRDFDRAVALMQGEEYGSAVKLLEQVIERTPGITAPYINLAVAYGHLNEPDRAEGHLQMALQLFSGHPVASNEYGLLLRRAGRFAEARAIYEKSLSEFPDYHPVRRNLGILCDIYMNDLAVALEHYQRYSDAMPEDEQVKLWIADLRIRLGR
jgi:tetratricopeptide (TPR) repeat protein